jgi:hypothetical protein
MIIETITVTTIPSTLLELIQTARTGFEKSSTVSDVIMRVTDIATTEPVLSESVEDGVAATVTPVTILDPLNGQTFASLGTGTQTVGLICSQLAGRC